MLGRDLRFALRSFAQNPGFTAVVITTLALGIGANSAIFTLVDAVLLRPLPVHDPAELTDIWTTCRRGYAYCSSSYPDILDYRSRSRSFSDLAAYTPVRTAWNAGGETSIVEGYLVTGSYFALLGVPASRGRPLTTADDRLGAASPVVVLSHGRWQREFGGDPDVVGAPVQINNVPFTVVGVAPAGFRGTRLSARPDFWIPMSAQPLIATGSDRDRDRLAQRNSRWIGGVIARRHPGVTVEQARADLVAIGQQLEEEYGRAGRTVTVEGTRTATLPASASDDIVRFVSLLMTVVGAALLIACANIANLLLSRATARRREISLRIALGAGRGRLVRQLLTESAVLSVGGALVGLGVAALALRVLAGYALPGFVSIENLGLHLDARAIGFTASLAMVTGLLFGLVPALQASSPNLTDALKEASSEVRGGRVMRMRAALLTLQTAMALVLLVGAGLFVRSLKNGLDSDVGFETRNLAMATFDLSMQDYTSDGALSFVGALTDRVAALPPARRVSASVWPPLADGGSGFFIFIPGYAPAENEELRIEANWVGSRFLETLGIRLVAGRDVGPQDRAGSPPVAVINETMANRWWPGRDPVGQTYRLGFDGSGAEVTIIGVARDVKDGLRTDPQPFIYYPMAQFPQRALDRQINVLVATDGPASAVLSGIRRHLAEMDSDLAVAELTTLENRFAAFLMPQRMGTMLLSALGGLAMLLAVVGITGVIGFAINQRRREIGIRLALGAGRRHVLNTVVRGAVYPVALGIGIGLIASVALTRLITSFMYDVTATDPATFVTVAGTTVAIALAAAYLPARRAARVDPTEALKAD